MSSDENFVNGLKPSNPQPSDTLAAERKGSSIDITEVSKHVRGRDELERQERILQQLSRHKVFDKAHQANLSRPDRYRHGLARAKQMIRLARVNKWDDADFDTAIWLISDMNPLVLTRSMFRQTIREQANNDQQRRWLPRIENWEFIGAYAQSEMGHGSNVRSIELEARYDPGTKEFVLNSPTLTSSKWWNGGLGKTANWAIVMAQLLLPTASGGDQYKNYGPHPFMVQVRNMKTFKPLPGIVVGDIGPKYGYATMDNAYMLFNKVRVPHDAFLSRYSKVDPDTGAYTPAQNTTVVYGSLTQMRTRYAMESRMTLARAVTIAVRYTSVRRQFTSSKAKGLGAAETAVLDYPTVQIRILPLLAACYALHYTGIEMGELYRSARSKAEKGDFSEMNEVHAVSSGLKSRCTEIAANGLETCRRALGGHGYGGYSGMVQLNEDYLSKPTVEGDNWMITQQNARYILKMAGKASVANPALKSSEGFVEAQLRQYRGSNSIWTAKIKLLGDVNELSTAFEHVFGKRAFEVHKAQNVDKRPEQDLLIQRHELSILQSSAMIVRAFANALKRSDIPTSLRPILPDLLRLWAYTAIQQHMFDFQSASFIGRNELARLPDEILALMKRIRPHAVSLIDAFAIPDYLLDSSLGRSDGKVYEDMFHRAHRLNPLNQVTFNSDYRSDELDVGADSSPSFWSKL